MVQRYKPSQIVYEEVSFHKSTYAAQIYGGYLAHLTALAEEEDIPYSSVPVTTLKKYATGKGNANKKQMIAAVQKRLKLEPHTSDEADAIWLLEYTLHGPKA